jgi:hypothetical protein
VVFDSPFFFFHGGNTKDVCSLEMIPWFHSGSLTQSPFFRLDFFSRHFQGATPDETPAEASWRLSLTDMTVAPGTLVAVTGRVGSGKVCVPVGSLPLVRACGVHPLYAPVGFTHWTRSFQASYRNKIVASFLLFSHKVRLGNSQGVCCEFQYVACCKT